MNHLLKSVLDMDKQARAEKKDALDYRDKVRAGLEAEKEAIRNEKLKAAKAATAELEKGLQQGVQRRIALLEDENAKQLQELEETCGKNRANWSDELFRRVIAR